MKRERLAAAIGILTGAAILTTWIWWPREGEATYVVAPAARATVTETLTLVGPVERDTQAELSFDTPGQVIAVEVSLGEEVIAGQPIARIDPAPLRLTVLTARASVAQAEAQLDADLTAQKNGGSTASPPAAATGTLPELDTGTAPGSDTTAPGSTGPLPGALGASGSQEPPAYLADLQSSLGGVQAALTAQQQVCTPVFTQLQELRDLGETVALPTAQPPLAMTPPPSAAVPATATPAATPLTPAAGPSATASVSPIPSPSPAPAGSATAAPTAPSATPETPVAPVTSVSPAIATAPAPSATSDSAATPPKPAAPSTSATLAPPTQPPPPRPSPLPTSLPTQLPTSLPTTLPPSWPAGLPSDPDDLTVFLTGFQACSVSMGVTAQAEAEAAAAIMTASQEMAVANQAAAEALAQAQAELAAATEQATQAAMEAAQQQLEEQLSALAGGVVTDATIARDRATLLQARQQLATAETDLAGATLTSPVSGTVGALGFVTGEPSTGASATIVGAGAATVTIDVPLSDRALVAPQTAATVGQLVSPHALSGEVTTVSVLPTGSTGSPRYATTVLADDPTGLLNAGAYAEVTLTLRDLPDVLTVPSSAVTMITDTTGTVEVVPNARAITADTITVVIGGRGGGRVEIVSGLNEGQLVALADRRLPVPGGLEQYDPPGPATPSPTATR